MGTPVRPFRVLFLCTGNSARSQMAESILNHRGQPRFTAESAGSQPAARVNPLAVAALQEAGIPWRGHQPRGLEGLDRERWDLVVTVCDNAREACPIFPGQPVVVHWTMTDPAAMEGTEVEKQKAFRDALALIGRRVDLLLELPVASLEPAALRQRAGRIGEVRPVTPLMPPDPEGYAV
jgi:arsenate reductase (thioredoxin)